MPWPGRLGGEKRLECPIKNFLFHAGAGVGDGDQDILTRLDLGVLLAISLVQIGVAGLDRQSAAFFHGVTGIDGQVQDRRLKFSRIGLHRPKAATSDDFERDVLAQGAAKKFAEPVDRGG